MGPVNSYWTDFWDSFKIQFWRILVILTFILQAHLFQKHCLFWIFSLFFRCREWLGECCVVLLWLSVFHSLRCFQTLELLTCFFPTSLPSCLSLLAFPPSRKPREIDKQQDRGNWAILFLLREPHFAALSESYRFLHLLARVLIDQWPLNAYADQ